MCAKMQNEVHTERLDREGTEETRIFLKLLEGTCETCISAAISPLIGI